MLIQGSERGIVFYLEPHWIFEMFYEFIVFVWSQYDGRNIYKEQLAKVPSKTKDAELMKMLILWFTI